MTSEIDAALRPRECPAPECGAPAVAKPIRDGCRVVCAGCGFAGPPKFLGPGGPLAAHRDAIAAWNAAPRPADVTAQEARIARVQAENDALTLSAVIRQKAAADLAAEDIAPSEVEIFSAARVLAMAGLPGAPDIAAEMLKTAYRIRAALAGRSA